jgi:L-ascorbate metabolism protein UlaG (beta-lactamase superfamily)
MRIAKFGHSCIRIEHDGHTLVIDPGGFTQPEAVDGADAVLVTHEHPDHYHPAHLVRASAPVFTIDAVAQRIREDSPEVAEQLTVVSPEQTFEAAGLPVRAVGEQHAVIHPDLPRFDNSGYVVTLATPSGDQKVFHPGDALTPPGEPVDLLCVVVSAPWMKVSEAVDFARLVGAPRNLAIHDRVYSEAGLGIVDGHLSRLLPDTQAYARVPDGADLV